MEMENFEEKLTQMTKPEVVQLKHQDMLASAIAKAKDQSVISWWWLSIPLFLIAALLMKTYYMPQTTLLQNIQEFTGREKYTSALLFLVLPAIFIVINFSSIRNMYFLSGSPKSIRFLRTAWFNVVMILFSILVLILYAL